MIITLEEHAATLVAVEGNWIKAARERGLWFWEEPTWLLPGYPHWLLAEWGMELQREEILRALRVMPSDEDAYD